MSALIQKRMDRFEAGLGTLGRKVDVGFDQVDQRFKHLEKKVDVGFDQADQRFKQLEKKVDVGFDQADQRFKQLEIKVDQGFDQANQRSDRLEDSIHREGVLNEERDRKIDLIIEVVTHTAKRLDEYMSLRGQVEDHEVRISNTELSVKKLFQDRD